MRDEKVRDWLFCLFMKKEEIELFRMFNRSTFFGTTSLGFRRIIVSIL